MAIRSRSRTERSREAMKRKLTVYSDIAMKIRQHRDRHNRPAEDIYIALAKEFEDGRRKGKEKAYTVSLSCILSRGGLVSLARSCFFSLALVYGGEPLLLNMRKTRSTREGCDVSTMLKRNRAVR